MNTVLLFLKDAYLFECPAEVTAVFGNLVVVDQTVYYPQIGVSLPDAGHLIRATGEILSITGSAWIGPGRSELGHALAPSPSLPAVGEKVIIRIDGRRRFLQMRLHTALHLVSKGFPFGIVAGKVSASEGYIDFSVDRTAMSTRVLQNLLTRFVAQEQPVSTVWLPKTIDLIDERPVAFTWPGRHQLVRAIKIDGTDIQACDGLHVANTREIGQARVRGIYPIALSRYRIAVSVANRRPFLGPAWGAEKRSRRSTLARLEVR